MWQNFGGKLFGLALLFLAVSLALAEEESPSSEAHASQIVVEVTGEVNDPGVHKLREGKRVWDAIEAAGGVTDMADLMDINVAAKLRDATRLHVPTLPTLEKQATKTLTNRPNVPPVYALNPPEYTRSGWLWLRETGQLPTPDRERGGGTSATKEDLGGLINLNTAGKPLLETLPGIGPATAEKIIAFREVEPFKRVEDLQMVSGIGTKKMEAVRHLVKVE